MKTSQPFPAAAPPPPTMENAFHVSVAPITQPLQAGPPVDVVLIVSIGPILFSNSARSTRVHRYTTNILEWVVDLLPQQQRD
jgi:hypothetical protein